MGATVSENPSPYGESSSDQEAALGLEKPAIRTPTEYLYVRERRFQIFDPTQSSLGKDLTGNAHLVPALQ